MGQFEGIVQAAERALRHVAEVPRKQEGLRNAQLQAREHAS